MLTATPNAPTAIDSDTLLPYAPRNTPPAPIVRFIILVRLTDGRTLPAPRVVTPRPCLTAAPLPPPTAPTAATTTMPSTKNAGLDQSLHLNPRPPHLPTKKYLTPPPTVRKPWMWATMATKHALLPKPLQPRPLIFTPPDPSSAPEMPQPPPVGPSQHPLAQACHQ